MSATIIQKMTDADLVALAADTNREDAVRWLAAEVVRLRAELYRVQQRASDAGWALDAAREQYETDHAGDWR